MQKYLTKQSAIRALLAGIVLYLANVIINFFIAFTLYGELDKCHGASCPLDGGIQIALNIAAVLGYSGIVLFMAGIAFITAAAAKKHIANKDKV